MDKNTQIPLCPKQVDRKKNVKTSIRIFLLVLVGFIIGVLFFLLVSSRIGGEAVPMPFGIGLADVLSGSMEPTLKIGDLLIVRESDVYEVGDIVVYRDKGMSVVHRIVWIDGMSVTTRGDANTSDDTPFDIEKINGKVVFRIPGLGYVTEFLKTPIGIILIVGLSVFLFELSFSREKQANRAAREELLQSLETLKKRSEGFHRK